VKREEAFDVMVSRGFFQPTDSPNSTRNRIALRVWDAFTVEGAWEDYPKDGQQPVAPAEVEGKPMTSIDPSLSELGMAEAAAEKFWNDWQDGRWTEEGDPQTEYRKLRDHADQLAANITRRLNPDRNTLVRLQFQGDVYERCTASDATSMQQDMIEMAEQTADRIITYLAQSSAGEGE
jgi:hypothetical protein